MTNRIPDSVKFILLCLPIHYLNLNLYTNMHDKIFSNHLNMRSLCKASYTPTFTKTLRPCYLNFPFNIYLLQHQRPIQPSLSLSLSLSLSISHIFTKHKIFFVVSTFLFSEKDFPWEKNKYAILT